MNISLKMRIIGLALFAALLPSVATFLLTSQARRHADRDVEERMNAVAKSEAEKSVESAYLMCQMTQKGLLRDLMAHLAKAQEIVERSGPVHFGEERVTWDAVNQFSKATHAVALPKMYVGETWLGQNKDPATESPVVDQAAIASLVYCTLFQRMNEEGDMLRVSTSVLDDEGQRAIGTYIPRVCPDGARDEVIDTVLRGETYLGRAYVVNSWHAAAYAPIWDTVDTNKIVGMLYIGFDMEESLRGLKDAIRAIRIGDTGYAGAIGAKGESYGFYIIGRTAADDGRSLWKKDGQENQALFDIQNRLVSTALAHPDSVSFEQYHWQNEGEPAPRRKQTALRYFQPWEWVVYAGVYEDDYYNIKHDITARIDGIIKFGSIVSGGAVLIALLFAFLISGAIANPIRRVVRIADHIAHGELSAANQQLAASGMAEASEQTTPSNNETITLYRAVSAMTKNLTS
ncbi:MAG: HAMP domain-containing protein, partial [Spartobacteria bacterium]|nr:HAMP domain-containing protein [Spartobacteria bacterium]